MRPRVFIGSSAEALPVARSTARALKPHSTPILWEKDVFLPSTFFLDGLFDEVQKCQLALFVFSNDDVVRLRGRMYNATRDNVVFELGLFMTKLGRPNCLFLVPQTKQPFRLPSDLKGLSYISYETAAVKRNPKTGLKPAIEELKATIDKLIEGDGSRLSLTGKWAERWNVTSKTFKANNASNAEIMQIGERLYGTSKANGRVYLLEGQIEHGDIFSGRWFDQQKGATYCGMFQLRIRGDAQEMKGQWIGFSSSSGEIKSGTWLWRRRE